MALKIDLSDQVAMVTGVSSGIGLGIAKMLAQSGCDVIGCGLRSNNTEEVQKFIATVEKHNRKAWYASVDVRKKEELVPFVEDGINKFGRIDLLVSNAGNNIFKGVIDCDELAWQENIDLNVSAHWHLSKRAYPFLKASKNGTIIIMNSNHAYHTIAGSFPYNVAKSALRGLVQSMAIEWGPEIRTVGLAPGFVDTPGNEKWFQSFPNPEVVREKVTNLHPVKKIATVEEIGAFCVFLASEYASFATGETYLVDGGRSAIMQDL